MLKNLGTSEIIIIVAIIIILFGAKKVPEFITGIAQAIRELKRAFASGSKEEEK